MVNNSFYNWQLVTSEVPQGSSLVSRLFNMFTSDLHDGIKYTLMKIDVNTKLSGEVDTVVKVDKEPPCRKVDRLEE